MLHFSRFFTVREEKIKQIIGAINKRSKCPNIHRSIINSFNLKVKFPFICNTLLRDALMNAWNALNCKCIDCESYHSHDYLFSQHFPTASFHIPEKINRSTNRSFLSPRVIEAGIKRLTLPSIRSNDFPRYQKARKMQLARGYLQYLCIKIAADGQRPRSSRQLTMCVDPWWRLRLVAFILVAARNYKACTIVKARNNKHTVAQLPI